jgi:hypothetical protein
MPQQVVYTLVGGYAAGTADALAGFQLNQNLHGMCAGAAAATSTGAFTANCVKFIPTVVTLADAVAGQTDPANTDGLNQARFVTGIVSGAGTGDPDISAYFSQRTTHYAGPDSDFIDQRLATMVNDPAAGVSNFEQSVQVSNCDDAIGNTCTEFGTLDGSWPNNGDNYGIISPGAGGIGGLATFAAGPSEDPNGANSGQIAQAIGDSNSGGTGDYGQLFQNTNEVIDGGNNPGSFPGGSIIGLTAPDGPAVSYIPSNLGVGPGAGSLP